MARTDVRGYEINWISLNDKLSAFRPIDFQAFKMVAPEAGRELKIVASIPVFTL
jgi:hypothetical protein